MNIYTLSALLLTTAVAIGYINHLYIRLQPTIAITCGAFLISIVMLIADSMGFTYLETTTAAWLSHVDFHNLLINGMLSFFLFAGALTIDFNQLKRHKFDIILLATLGTIASTCLIGFATHYLLGWFGIKMPMIYCFLFGSLISPTDPIAVLATLKKLKAPHDLTVTLAGESLFNDGIGIVIFLSLYQLAFSNTPLRFYNVAGLFLQQAIGGIGYGVVLGMLAYRLIKGIEDHSIEILVTLALVTGGYVFAQYLHVSGALAMVVAGIFLGNRGKDFSMPKGTRRVLHVFWEIIDEVLNALLFLLIGFELLAIDPILSSVWIGLLIIPVTLLVRAITVILPLQLTRKLHSKVSGAKRPPYMNSILIWGGLRGGLALALALSLPNNEYRDLILTITYCVVCFSVIVQGITVKPLIRLSARKKALQ